MERSSILLCVDPHRQAASERAEVGNDCCSYGWLWQRVAAAGMTDSYFKSLSFLDSVMSVTASTLSKLFQWVLQCQQLLKTTFQRVALANGGCGLLKPTWITVKLTWGLVIPVADNTEAYYVAYWIAYNDA